MQRHGGADRDKNPPDEKVLAQCLAITSLEVLIQFLRIMDRATTRPGDSYMWFVTTLLQRIHRASPKLTKQRQELLKARKPPQAEYEPQFTQDILQHAAAGVRGMR
jgi:hypothetical protein